MWKKILVIQIANAPLKISDSKTMNAIFLLLLRSMLVVPAFLEPTVLGSGKFNILLIMIDGEIDPIR
jgi:hypothetical protein